MVHIELQRIYITLRATQQRALKEDERWLAQKTAFAPGEMRRHGGEERVMTETVTVSVNEALREHKRLVVLGDPGSGKTTLLRYLALVYARDMDRQTNLVQQKLDLPEKGILPILLPLRKIGAFLQTQRNDGTLGHKLLLQFLHNYLKNERIDIPLTFFDDYLTSGKAVILLDGMDEVAGVGLRQQVAQMSFLHRQKPMRLAS